MPAVPIAPDRVFIALDVVEPAAAVALARRLAPAGVRFKLGPVAFTRGGPAVLEAVQAAGGPVFLDLKLHDIPNTVAGGVAAAASLGAWGVTVHSSGGAEMLRAAAAAAGERLRVVAVTVLTSLDGPALAEVGLERPVDAQVALLAALASRCGCHAVVASPREVGAVRAAAPGLAVVTPGIRPAGAAAGDQRRTDTPRAALAAGADFLVVGRAVTAAADPETALAALLAGA